MVLGQAPLPVIEDLKMLRLSLGVTSMEENVEMSTSEE